MRWSGHVARLGEKNACRILVGKPDVKKPLGDQDVSWVDNIKMDLREIGWISVDWIDMTEDRDRWWTPLDTVMNL
jgi:hypothetical protein